MGTKFGAAAALLGLLLLPAGALAKGAQGDGAASAATKPSTGKVGEKLPAFTAKATRDGKGFDFDSAKTGKTTVYVLVAVNCPATEPYAERLCLLEAAYMRKEVEFVYLYVNGDKVEPLAEKTKFHKKCKFTGVFLSDGDSAIGKKLAATRTGEVLIVDKDGKVVYRGGIDDSLNDPSKVKAKYVADALDQLLAGKPVTTTTGKSFGCPIRA
jgi:peroxiredoxin